MKHLQKKTKRQKRRQNRQNRTTRARGRNIALIIACGVTALFLIAVFTPAVLGLTLYRDDSEVNESGLKLSKVSAAKKDNAFFDLLKLQRGPQVYDSMPDSRMVSGVSWDAKAARRIISENKQTLRILRNAADRKYYQNPDIADPNRISLKNSPTNLMGYRQAASVSNVRAYHLARAGKYLEAMDQALVPMVVGAKIQNSQPGLGEYMMAGAMKSMSVKAVEDILPVIDLPPIELKRYAAELNQGYQNRSGLAAALKSDYYAGAESINLMREPKNQLSVNLAAPLKDVGKPKNTDSWTEMFYMSWGRNKFYVQPNKTANKKAAFYRLLITEVTRPCNKAANPSAFDKFQPKVRPAALLALDPAAIKMPNAYGETLLAIALPSPHAVSKNACENDLTTAATQTMLGLKAYKDTTGALPKSLTDLVPLFIDQLPADPYGNSSLLYSPEKKILYSVGKDGKDSGGVADPATLPSRGLDPRLDHMKDPSFKIKF